MTQKSGEPLKKKKNAEAPAETKPAAQSGRLKQFFGEVKAEFNKIAWPDRKHTLGSTAVVVVLVIIISFYLGAVDLLLGKIISAILR